MAINIEEKHRLKELEARIASLEASFQSLESQPAVAPLKEPKKCPHCGVAPAYFFHVKACKKQKEEKTHGDDRSRS
jgi:hypothetical protein